MIAGAIGSLHGSLEWPKRLSPLFTIVVISCATLVGLSSYLLLFFRVQTASSGSVLKEQNLMTRVDKCSFLERQLIRATLSTSEDFTVETGCPISDAWLQEYLEREAVRKKFVFLNFGCNKGYDSIRVAQTVTRNAAVFNKEKWKMGLGIEDAGICNQGGVDDDSPSPVLRGPVRPVEVHCIEAMPSNFKALKQASDVTSAEAHGLKVHFYAMTGTPNMGSISFPDSSPGTEHLGIGSCMDGTKSAEYGCVDVPATTMDEFVSKHVGIKLKDDAGMEDRLPYVSVDIEGYDFTVMQSGKRTLKQTDYLEFEFNAHGDWGHQNLYDCIEMLHSLDLHCYWSGVNKLWKITNCWVDTYHGAHQWSNIACVNPLSQPGLFQTMEAVFESTIEQTLQDFLEQLIETDDDEVE
jgi:hypothetical protein